jgi:hypothetical protein
MSVTTSQSTLLTSQKTQIVNTSNIRTSECHCDAENSIFKHGACNLLTQGDVDSTFSKLSRIHTDNTMSMYHMQNTASSESLLGWPWHIACGDWHVSGNYSSVMTLAWNRLARYLHCWAMLTTKRQTPDSPCVPTMLIAAQKRLNNGDSWTFMLGTTADLFDLHFTNVILLKYRYHNSSNNNAL